MPLNVYSIESVSYGDAVVGITDIALNKGGSAQRFFADGDLYSQFNWLENLQPTVQVTTSDLSECSSLACGDTAALILEYGLRATGGGITGGSSITATFNSSTILGALAPTASQQGPSSMGLSFFGISTDGYTNPCAMSIA